MFVNQVKPTAGMGPSSMLNAQNPEKERAQFSNKPDKDRNSKVAQKSLLCSRQDNFETEKLDYKSSSPTRVQNPKPEYSEPIPALENP